MTILKVDLIEYGLKISLSIAMFCSIPAFVVTYRLKKRYGNANWLPVPATVISSTIEESGGRPKHYFTPVINFRYEYQGESFTSTILSPDIHNAGSSDPAFAKKWVALLPVGSQITAFVDQNSPSTAVLFPDYRNGWIFTFGVMFAVFGMFCFFIVLFLFSFNIFAPNH